MSSDPDVPRTHQFGADPAPNEGVVGNAGLASSFVPLPIQNLLDDHLLLTARRIVYDGVEVPCLSGIPLLVKLGEGGMGAVYYGIHPRLEREVAVKILPPGVAEKNPKLIPRFIREAKLAARIESPHLVRVLDVDHDGRLHFLVMEFVRGVSAGEYLKAARKSGAGGVSEDEALTICIAACNGLAAAHAEDIIHRDVKPDNIMLPRSKKTGALELAKAKVADLGLARIDIADPDAITVTGMAMGTPGFMAPEQADAKTCTKPADVFGLGATLYALLAGRPPFAAETPYQTLKATIEAPHKPIREKVPTISAPTAKLLDRCLAKKVAHRFEDAGTLLEALTACRDALKKGTEPKPKPKPSRSWLWAALVMMAVLGGAVGGWAYLANGDATKTALATVPVPTPGKMAEAKTPSAPKTVEPLMAAEPQKVEAPKETPKPPPVEAPKLDKGKKVEPVNAPSTPGESPKSTPSKDADTLGGYKIYVVKPGDNMTRIANANLPGKGGSRAILDANKDILPDPNKLREGMKLRIPNAIPAEPETLAATHEAAAATAREPAKEISLDCGVDAAGKKVPMELVLIPAGEFDMGSPETELERIAEREKQHHVTISKAFYMAKYVVTQEQFEAVIGKNPSNFTTEKGGGPKHPVENVSWFEAVKFCEELTKKVKAQLSANSKVTLPSEAQWEYACRAGSTTPFNFDGKISAEKVNYDSTISYEGSPKTEKDREKTVPVDSFQPNKWELYQMHGNVYQWCQDVYVPEHEKLDAKDPKNDPPGDTTKARVCRGGSWIVGPNRSRSAYRRNFDPDYRYYGLIGFRVVVVPLEF